MIAVASPAGPEPITTVRAGGVSVGCEMMLHPPPKTWFVRG
eukprot:CAMPEP_0177750510 /NCGR_PEP_ID=MMETSP0484_2-20121128/33060_1 /TAXON_ID=354590 /ORGANISM="Rhodomonas lens, Strain RHODO" /LENGTH=40 /DNA_ID= /DNA_START= /DNA_END= /DNA_ORIENTATION=